MTEETDLERQADAVTRLALEAVQVARETQAIRADVADELTDALQTILAELQSASMASR